MCTPTNDSDPYLPSGSVRGEVDALLAAVGDGPVLMTPEAMAAEVEESRAFRRALSQRLGLGFDAAQEAILARVRQVLGFKDPANDLERLRVTLAGAGYAEIDGDYEGADVRYSSPSKIFMVSRDGAAYGAQYPQSIDLADGSGYDGMACSFFFDEAGALVGHAVWE